MIRRTNLGRAIVWSHNWTVSDAELEGKRGTYKRMWHGWVAASYIVTAQISSPDHMIASFKFLMYFKMLHLKVWHHLKVYVCWFGRMIVTSGSKVWKHLWNGMKVKIPIPSLFIFYELSNNIQCIHVLIPHLLCMLTIKSILYLSYFFIDCINGDFVNVISRNFSIK